MVISLTHINYCKQYVTLFLSVPNYDVMRYSSTIGQSFQVFPEIIENNIKENENIRSWKIVPVVNAPKSSIYCMFKNIKVN